MEASKVLQAAHSTKLMAKPVVASPPRAALVTPAAPLGGMARCSRCQCTWSIDVPVHGMVRFGVNSYYCRRCADLVGLKR